MQEFFQTELGTLRGYEAKIRTVLYALREKVEQELAKGGLIEPVQFADWAAPIMPVMKKDGMSLRICGD